MGVLEHPKPPPGYATGSSVGWSCGLAGVSVPEELSELPKGCSSSILWVRVSWFFDFVLASSVCSLCAGVCP